MKRVHFSIALVAAVLMTLNAKPAQADVIVAGYTLNVSAFPTSATYLSGGPPSLSFPTTGNINSDLLKATDSDLTSYIYGTPVTFDVTFGNAPLLNGTGADLVVFELGIPDQLQLTVGGITHGFTTTGTGYSTAGFEVNAVAIDLADFGLAGGSTVGTIRVNNTSPVTGSTSIAAIGGLNTSTPTSPVPEPASLMMLSTAILAMGLVIRTKRLH